MAAQTTIFTAPLGLTKPIPESRKEEYRAISENLKPFQRHEYDIDICVLLRQMEELSLNGNEEIKAYSDQIRQTAAHDLKKSDLEVDYCLDHFYYTIQPNNISYQTYLPLFFSVNDFSKLRQLLEYHQWKCAEVNKKDFDFLDVLEYEVCPYIRKNKFPIDWILRHDRIIDWVYDKRNQLISEKEEAQRWNDLIKTLNDRLLTNISPIKVRPAKQIAKEQGGIDVLYKDILYEDLKSFFNRDSHDSLKRILHGEDSNEVLIFHGNANQLVDVFRIYHEERRIHMSKQKVFLWLRRHFLYLSDNDGSTSIIGGGAINILYGKDLPPKDKRIKLSQLDNLQHTYYR